MASAAPVIAARPQRRSRVGCTVGSTRSVRERASSLVRPPVKSLVEWMTVSGVKGKPPSQSRREKAQATRLRIVEAALAAFLDRGYSGTTMDAVAAQAGVAVQTVYFVFHTKRPPPRRLRARGARPGEGAAASDWWWRAVEEEPEVVPAVRTLVKGSSICCFGPLLWSGWCSATRPPGRATNSTKGCAATAMRSSSAR